MKISSSNFKPILSKHWWNVCAHNFFERSVKKYDLRNFSVKCFLFIKDKSSKLMMNVVKINIFMLCVSHSITFKDFFLPKVEKSRPLTELTSRIPDLMVQTFSSTIYLRNFLTLTCTKHSNLSAQLSPLRFSSTSRPTCRSASVSWIGVNICCREM